MQQDIFDKLLKQDLFDRISLDLFDDIELPVEDKVIYSKDMEKLLREEINKAISKIPIGKILSKILEKETERQVEHQKETKASVSKEIAEAKAEIKNEVKKLKKEEEDLMEKMRKKYADLRNEIMNQPRYEFGGFSPQYNDLNIGDPATDGNWRIVRSGSNLSVQNRVSGSWVEAFAFTPNA